MKTPQQYIDAVSGGCLMLTHATAQLAIAQAQADLHEYYRHLMRAVRNSRSNLPQTEEAA